MLARRIPVSPMHDSAFGVPLVLSAVLNNVALFQIIDARREIDVVRDEQRLPRLQTNNEALMATAVGVIGKNPGNDSSALNLCIARLGAKSTA
jgi:hypothetical protein